MRGLRVEARTARDVFPRTFESQQALDRRALELRGRQALEAVCLGSADAVLALSSTLAPFMYQGRSSNEIALPAHHPC